MRACPERSRRAPTKKIRRTGPVGWLRSIAGHATTETVIMIPIFVAIWGGLWYTHQRYRKALNMAQYTRAHVWAHAYDACEGTPSGSTTITDRSDDRSGFLDGFVSSAIAAIPGFSFEEIEGRRRASLERPTVLGEGTVTMRHNLVVLCNEPEGEDPNLGTTFRRAWGMFF